MSKLILRSNVNTSYTVETKSIDTIIGKPIKYAEEVIITPKPGYNIKAEDFTSGVLSSPISNITYYNANNRVIARVEFNDQPITSEVVNIYLPISGNLKRVDNTLVLTENTIKNDNVLESTTRKGVTQSANVYDSSSVYKISTQTPGLSRVLSKTLFVPNGFYFEEEPTYSISGNNSRYKVSINVVKDANNRITKKSFEIFYNFPEQNPVIEPTNTITFNAKSKKLEVNRKKVIAEIKEDYKIYNVDYGRKLGLEGGMKHIKVNGVPGTKFKVLVQDSDKKVYDFKTGGFQTSASFLEGVIPAAEPGIGYGTFDAFLNVAASTTATTISTKVITEAPTKTTDETGAVTTIIPDSLDEEVVAETTATFELIKDSVAYVVTRPALASEEGTLTDAQITNGVSDGTYAISALTGQQAESRVEYYEGTSEYLTWDITCADDKVIGINRQPIFDPTKTYVNWDSGHSSESEPLLKRLNNAGDAINNDVDNMSTLSGWEFNDVTISLQSHEEGDTLDGSDLDGGFVAVYTKLTISIHIASLTAGTANINPELNLDNFITLVSL